MTGRTPVNILMDVDTGVDDAMALAMAVASPDLNLVGVTTVAGNVSLIQATDNTLRVLDYLGATDVPVNRGMSRPLSRDHFDAAHFHGSDGLGGAPLPASQRMPEAMTAPEFIVRSAHEYRGQLTLVFVGPLTNLAVALALEPDLPELVSRTVIMGGAFTVPGNTTPWAEFNVAVDPEAAMIVAESTLHATWVGLDVTSTTNLYRNEWERIDDDASMGARLVREVSRRAFAVSNYDEMHLHDPLAVGVALQPDLIECQQTSILVDTSIRDAAGMTRMVTGDQSSMNQVAVKVDRDRFRAMFGEILGVPLVESAIRD